MPRQTETSGKHWYVLHTYSGYEDAVATNLKQRIQSMDMDGFIFEVLVPTESKIKIKNGKRRTIREKIFPGYVLVHMMVNDESWYVVRNTPGVTGFVGTGITPTPVSDDEIASLQKRMGLEEPKYQMDILIGSPVKIVDGPFKDFDGKVSEVDESRGKVKVLVPVFNRETPIELDYLQVKKI